MKNQLSQLLKQLKATSFATKAVLVASVLGLIGIVGITSWRASIPHYVLLASNLSAAEAAACEAALANAGIRYDVSQPPGPFVLRVDEPRKQDALAAMALAGARVPGERGIPSTASGASSIFKSANEREQTIAKQRWQECEKQLEYLTFVAAASVNSHGGKGTAFGRTDDRTVSVMITVKSGRPITYLEGESVARIVCASFGVPADRVTVSDQTGQLAWGGKDEGHELGGSLDLTKHKRQQDSYYTSRLQSMLDRTFGTGLIDANVDTTWTHEREETIVEAPHDKAVPVSTTEHSTTSPGGANSVGGIPGTSSNILDDVSNAGSTGPGGGAGVASTSDKSTRSIVGMKTQYSLKVDPVLTKTMVTLVVDESLSEKAEEIKALALSSVGLSPTDKDSIALSITPLATVERDEEGNIIPAAPVEPPEPPNELVELALQYGIEGIAAIAFLFVLLKSMKSARQSLQEALKGSESGAVTGDETIDPEVAARIQIDRLLESDPELVGEILSRWALEEAGTSATATAGAGE